MSKSPNPQRKQARTAGVMRYWAFVIRCFALPPRAPVLPLAAADELPDLWHQHVHGCHRLAVVVEPHIEGLDLLGVVVHDDWLLVDHLTQVALMLSGKVNAPVHILGGGGDGSKTHTCILR